MNFIDNNSDTDTLNFLAKSISPEIMSKALNHSGLVQREVQVKGKNGRVFMRKQWVKASEETQQKQYNSNSVSHDSSKPVRKTDHLVSINSMETIPDHIRDANIPPDWREVMVSPDPHPKSEILVVGKDSKNRAHYIYTKEHWDRVNSEKFQRVSDLMEKRDDLVKAIQLMENRDTADCLNLILKMGLRPGSDRDTKSKVKAYGATTLLGKHVVTENGDVYLRFVGKKGVNQDHQVNGSRIS